MKRFILLVLIVGLLVCSAHATQTVPAPIVGGIVSYTIDPTTEKATPITLIVVAPGLMAIAATPNATSVYNACIAAGTNSMGCQSQFNANVQADAAQRFQAVLDAVPVSVLQANQLFRVPLSQ